MDMMQESRKAQVQITNPFALIPSIPSIPFDEFDFGGNEMLFTKTPKLEYIDEEIINWRLTSIYNTLSKGNYDSVRFLIEDTISMLRTTTVVAINTELYNKIIDELYQMILEIVFKRYDVVHNKIQYLSTLLKKNKE